MQFTIEPFRVPKGEGADCRICTCVSDDGHAYITMSAEFVAMLDKAVKTAIRRHGADAAATGIRFTKPEDAEAFASSLLQLAAQTRAAGAGR